MSGHFLTLVHALKETNKKGIHAVCFCEIVYVLLFLSGLQLNPKNPLISWDITSINTLYLPHQHKVLFL